VTVILGHVGKNNLISRFQALNYLDAGDGGASKFNLHSHRSLTSVQDLEQAYKAVPLPVDRTTDVQHVVQAFESDRAIDAEVGTGALGRWSIQSHVDGDGAVQYRWINPDHMARNDAIASIDDRALIKLNVAGLGFCNFDFSF